MQSRLSQPTPSCDPAEALPPRPQAGQEACPASAGILIAEDEECVRDVLRRWLSVQGYRAWVAGDGFEAMQVYRLHQASIDLVLLDVCMPGLDGPQTLAALRAVNPTVRVAFMSGNPGAYCVEQLLSLGACGFLAKPFRLEHATELLRQWTATATV